VLKALDAAGPIYAFELVLERIPEAKRKGGGKARARLELSPFMPLGRDFAFVVAEEVTAGDLTRAVAGADKALIADARVFDVFRGPSVGDGRKSLAVEITIQPRERTLTEAEIEQLSARVIEAAGKLGATLRA
jgi:phenylalanyl-tRNA synthetase beta chain